MNAFMPPDSKASGEDPARMVKRLLPFRVAGTEQQPFWSSSAPTKQQGSGVDTEKGAPLQQQQQSVRSAHAFPWQLPPTSTLAAVVDRGPFTTLTLSSEGSETGDPTELPAVESRLDDVNGDALQAQRTFYDEFIQDFPQLVRVNKQTEHLEKMNAQAVARLPPPTDLGPYRSGRFPKRPLADPLAASARNRLIDRFEEDVKERCRLSEEERKLRDQVKVLTVFIFERIKERKAKLEQMEKLKSQQIQLAHSLDSIAKQIEAYQQHELNASVEGEASSSENIEEPLTSTTTQEGLDDAWSLSLINYRHVKHSDACIKTLSGHVMPVTCLDFKDLHGGLVSGSDDGTLRLWDLGRWRPLRTVFAHEGPVRSVCMDAEWTVSGSEDRRVRLWQFPNVQSTPLSLYDASSDEDFLQTTLHGHMDAVQVVQSDLRHGNIVSGSADGTAKLWDAQHEVCLETFLHVQTTTASAFTAGWELPERRSSFVDGRRACRGVTALQFYEHALATGGEDGLLKLWDMRAPSTRPCSTLLTPKTTTTSTSDPTWPLFCAGDASRSSSSSSSGSSTSTRSESPQLLLSSSSSSSSSSSRGRGRSPVVAETKLRREVLLQPKWMRELKAHESNTAIVSIQFDGLSIVSAGLDQQVRVMDLRQPERAVECFSFEPTVYGITAMKVDAKRWVVAPGDETVVIWDRQQGVRRTIRGHVAPVRCLQLVDDRLISGGDDAVLKLWEL